MKRRRVIVVSSLACLAGCASDKAAGTRPVDPASGQGAAVRDPFSYGPGKDFGQDKPKELDEKGTLKEDWKRFWNP